MNQQVSIDIISIYEDVLNSRRKMFPPYTWTPENDGHRSFKRCMEYLIYERLQLTRDEIVASIEVSFFSKWRLYSPVLHLFDCSPFKAISYALPDEKILPWELRAVAKDTWNDETKKTAIRWLINDKLRWNREDIVNKLKYQTFTDHSLSTLVYSDDKNIYEIMTNAFPEYNFMPNEFIYQEKSDEQIRQVLRHLIEDTLGWSYEDILKKIDKHAFMDHGLHVFFIERFNGSPYKAMTFLYPDKNWSSLKRAEKMRGENHRNTVFTDADVIQIRELYKEIRSYAEIARRYGVAPSTIQHIVKRKTWTHIE